MTPLINACYAKALDVLRIQAVKFFLIDSQGKAKIEDLRAGIYYVCGMGETSRKSGIWNVRIDLRSGKNSLVSDSKNMTGRKKM